MKFTNTSSRSQTSHHAFVFMSLEESHFSSHRAALKEDIRAAKQGIEQNLTISGKSVDTLVEEAKTKINKSRDSIHGAVENIKISGPSSQARVDIITFKKEISGLAQAAATEIDKSKALYEKREKAIKKFSEYEVKKPKLQKKHGALFSYFKKLAIYADIPESDNVTDKNNGLNDVKAALSNVRGKHAEATTYLKDMEGLKTLLTDAKDGASPELNRKIESELTLVQGGIDEIQIQVDGGARVYNSVLKGLKQTLPQRITDETKMVTTYQSQSGKSQGEMDAGKITSSERMEAYNQYKTQQQFVENIGAFAQEVEGFNDLPVQAGAPKNLG